MQTPSIQKLIETYCVFVYLQRNPMSIEYLKWLLVEGQRGSRYTQIHRHIRIFSFKASLLWVKSLTELCEAELEQDLLESEQNSSEADRVHLSTVNSRGTKNSLLKNYCPLPPKLCPNVTSTRDLHYYLYFQQLCLILKVQETPDHLQLNIVCFMAQPQNYKESQWQAQLKIYNI